MNSEARIELEKILLQPDAQINLAEAALMVARLEYPDLDVEHYLQKVQTLGEEIRHRLPESPSAGDALNQLNQVLFVEKRFQGNTDEYYDPKNSFLNDVLERKIGIPITLSILYMHLGEMLQLPLMGVSFPGHFLVKLDLNDGAIILDPYYGGISLSEDDLYERLQDFYGSKVKRQATYEFLESCTRMEIIVRIMRNLRNLYMYDGLWEKALTMADVMVGLDTDKADTIKARAAIYDKLECSKAALSDYKKYLKIQPDGQDNMKIRSRIIQLTENCRYIN